MTARALGQRTVRLGSAALAITLASGCGPGPARDVILSRDLTIKGAFASSAPIQGFLLSDDGARTPIDGFRFDVATGKYEFGVPTEAIRFEGALTDLDRVTALNELAPRVPRGRLSRATIGSLTFELAPAFGTLASGPLPAYARVVAAIPRAAALAAEKIIDVDVAPVATAGAALVKVVDANGEPVEGARVFGVALSLADAEKPKPVRPWEAGIFRPVATKTDTAGEALVFPLPTPAAGFAFQLVTERVGFCVATTSPIALGPDTQSLKVTLAACATATTPPSVPDLDVQIAAATATRVEDAGKTALVRDDLPVRLDLRIRNLALGGLAIRVYAGEEATGQPLDEKLYDVIPPHVVVTIPPFLANASPDGRFAIGVSPVLAGLNDPPVHTVRGIRNSLKPLAKADRFRVQGGGGTADVVSSLPEATFKVTFLDCTGTQDFGVHFGLSAPTAGNAAFVRCDPSGNVFQASAFNLTAFGGARPMTFFRRDDYGNVSAAVDDDSNRRTVLVDAIAPVLAENAPALDLDFGFAPAGAAGGTDALPYVFRKGIPAQMVRLHPAVVPGVVLRFAKPGSCRTEPAAGQVNPDERDLLLATFTLVPPAGAERTAACSADLAVSAQDFAFPLLATEPATMMLKAADLAGNQSAAFSYEIAPCSRAGVDGVCWER